MTKPIVAELRRRPGRRGRARPGVAVADRLRRDGQLDEAEKILRASLAADEHDRDAWLGLARLNEARRRFTRAAYCAWRAVRIKPGDVSLLRYLGDLLILAGDYRRAEIVFSDLIAQRPDNLQAYICRSVVEREQGRIDESRRTLEAGVRRNPITVFHGFSATPIRVLRLHGVEKAYHILASPTSGGTGIALHSGNFSTERLLHGRRFTTIGYLVCGDNLLHTEPPPHEVVVNAIADPDVEIGSLRTAAKFLARNPDIPFVNDPLRVIETARDRNYQRLRSRAGTRFPKTFRLRRTDAGAFDLQTLLDRHEMDFPVILRLPGTHTGQTTAKAETLEAAHAYLRNVTHDEVYVIEYIDCRFQGEFYRKMRVFFIDGKIYPVVHHIDRVWNVHGGNRRTVMARASWMTDVEQTFLKDPAAYIGAEPYRRLDELKEMMGLDFFGVDFTITEAGELLIYEANPCMRHSFDHARAFPYLLPHLKDITAAFQRMVTLRAESSAASPDSRIQR